MLFGHTGHSSAAALRPLTIHAHDIDNAGSGGTGDDLFVFRDGDGADTIIDFTAVQAAASQVGDDTLLDFGGGDTVTLIGVDVASLDADDFLI
ncbi:MAG: hypothetical protein VCD33_16665 [Alphaproteobacteria bacterium]